MQTLISKIQYKDYPVGEFTDSQARTIDETIQLFYTFPWEEQRHNTSVELTGPSITIEKDDTTFLKISHYFAGKFCLYFSFSGTLYEKPIPTMKEVEVFIHAIFNGYLEEQLTSFEKPFSLKNTVNHFKSATCEFTPNSASEYQLVKFPLVQNLILFGIIAISSSNLFNLTFIIPVLLFIFLFSSVNFLLCSNYYHHDKDSYLKVAMTEDLFEFGTREESQVYDKKEIKLITKYKNNAPKCWWSECVTYHLTLENHTTLIFSSILISEKTFNIKFRTCQMETVHKLVPVIE